MLTSPKSLTEFALDLSWFNNLGWTNTRTKQEKQAQIQQTIQRRTKTIKSQKNKQMWKSLIYIKWKEKTNLEGWFSVKN